MHVATPETWYRVYSLENGVAHIEEPFIKPFYRCNIWHIGGRDRDLLVDSGMGVVSLRREISRLAERPVLAVATHTHFDHIGNHHEFADRLVHHAEADLMERPTRAGTVADRFVSDDIFTTLPPGGFRAEAYEVMPAPATRLIGEGDRVDLGDRSFEILHLPGHSPGSIGLWEVSTGILFSGDAVYDGPLVDDCYHSDLGDYLRTMERLLDLPVRVVHGGHFPSFGRERFRELIRGFLDEKRSATPSTLNG